MANGTATTFAYAPPSGVLSIIERFRDRGIPAPFDAETMTKAGISESLANRTLLSLRSLALIDEAGNPTEQFRDLAAARGEEYRERLGSILRDTYSPIFSFVDPATDSVEQVQEAFRGYEPRGQRSRMVTLFLGLCQAAGLAPDGAVKRATSAAKRVQPAVSSRTTRRQPALKQPAKKVPPSGALPAAVQGLLDSLPDPNEGWTQHQREKFLATFAAVIDFAYPIRETDLVAWAQGEIEDEDLDTEGDSL